jgi:hypothetical protein|eukprot:2080600-Prymnesium_polylepis.5
MIVVIRCATWQVDPSNASRRHCQSYNQAGMIYSSGGSLFIHNCKFEKADAPKEGGMIFCAHPASLTTPSSLEISDRRAVHPFQTNRKRAITSCTLVIAAHFSMGSPSVKEVASVPTTIGLSCGCAARSSRDAHQLFRGDLYPVGTSVTFLYRAANSSTLGPSKTGAQFT